MRDALIRLAARLTDAGTLQEVLSVVTEEASNALRSPVSVYLADGGSGQLRLEATHGLAAGAAAAWGCSTLQALDSVFGDDRLAVIDDVRQTDPRAQGLRDEHDVRTVALARMTRRGETVGMLAALSVDEWHRFGPEDLQTLRGLADQATQAVASAGLLEELRRLNTNLMLAYDSTLEGWSRALDLRDRETEGHTRRVTDLSIRLALEFGIRGEDLVHLRRGAMLHDIGKMGIPDSILLKPGPLTDDEWRVMRQHPVLAYELLKPIPYLEPAVDIPYCHHERWDGTGYPRGLRGTDIPLAARIFAVVDVWDALRSDRPYRRAWPAATALEYIHTLSGAHFDPAIVSAFGRVHGT